MQLRSLFPMTLLIVSMIGTSASAATLTLRGDGVEFPDGSVQTTAAQLGEPVGTRQPVTIPDLAPCSAWTELYAVPADFELSVDWVSVEIRVFGNLTVDVDLRTHDALGSADHALARLSDAEAVGLTPWASQRWSSEVTLHSVGGQAVEFRACRNTDSGDSVVLVSFSGRLFEATP